MHDAVVHFASEQPAEIARIAAPVVSRRSQWILLTLFIIKLLVTYSMSAFERGNFAWDYFINSLSMSCTTVGPASTMNVAGKMNSTSGNVSLRPDALAADSSAANCRLVLQRCPHEHACPLPPTCRSGQPGSAWSKATSRRRCRCVCRGSSMPRLAQRRRRVSMWAMFNSRDGEGWAMARSVPTQLALRPSTVRPASTQTTIKSRASARPSVAPAGLS